MYQIAQAFEDAQKKEQEEREKKRQQQMKEISTQVWFWRSFARLLILWQRAVRKTQETEKEKQKRLEEEEQKKKAEEAERKAKEDRDARLKQKREAEAVKKREEDVRGTEFYFGVINLKFRSDKRKRNAIARNMRRRFLLLARKLKRRGKKRPKSNANSMRKCTNKKL